MSNRTETDKIQRLRLYVCSGCEACDHAAIFLRGWTNGRLNVQFEILTLDQRPEDVIRYGITHTPALLLNDELLAQNLSLETVTELLEENLDSRNHV